MADFYQDILDENEEVLTGHDRKEKNRLFKAIRNGAFDDMEGISPASTSFHIELVSLY